VRREQNKCKVLSDAEELLSYSDMCEKYSLETIIWRYVVFGDYVSVTICGILLFTGSGRYVV